jgi:rhamnosyltransferase
LVSVIIPTLNGAEFIGALLASLREQSIVTEQIIIDSASTDNTVAIARAWEAKVIQIRREDFDHGATRNRAVEEASGDPLVFMTQDALPLHRFVLERLVGALNAPNVAASYGRQVARDNASPPERFARKFNYPPESLIKTRDAIPRFGIKTFFFSNVCSSVRKEIFNRFGGFPEGVIMDEDMLFSVRAINEGFGIAYVSEAEVFHSHPYTLFQQFRRYFDIGVFFRDHADLFRYNTMSDEGSRFVREEFRFLWKNNARLWVPYALIELICRYGGYKLGHHYPYIPQHVRRWMSLHRGFWDKR